MRDRAGTALYWLATAIAVLIVALGLAVLLLYPIEMNRGAHEPRSYLSLFGTLILPAAMIIGATVVAAAIAWLIGLTCRHLLCTGSPHLRVSTYTQIARAASGIVWLCLIWSGVVAASALANGGLAIGIAMLMVSLLQTFGLISSLYVAPRLRRWAYAPNAKSPSR